MRRHARWQTTHPHHWPVHRGGTHIAAAPGRDVVTVAETSPAAADTAPTDTAGDGELAALPWIGLYYAAEGP